MYGLWGTDRSEDGKPKLLLFIWQKGSLMYRTLCAETVVTAGSLERFQGQANALAPLVNKDVESLGGHRRSQEQQVGSLEEKKKYL